MFIQVENIQVIDIWRDVVKGKVRLEVGGNLIRSENCGDFSLISKEGLMKCLKVVE
jgi:hypothetical protein